MKKLLIVLVLIVLAIPSLAKAGQDGDTSCDKGMALVCVEKGVDETLGTEDDKILTGKSGKVLPVCPATETGIALACKSKDEVRAAEKAAKAELAKAKKKAEAKTEPAFEQVPVEQPKSSDSDKVKEKVDKALGPVKDTATPVVGGEAKGAGSEKFLPGIAEVTVLPSAPPPPDLSGIETALKKQAEATEKIAAALGAPSSPSTVVIEEKGEEGKGKEEVKPSPIPPILPPPAIIEPEKSGKEKLLITQAVPAEKKQWCERHHAGCIALWTFVGVVLVSGAGVGIAAAAGGFGDVNVTQGKK